jgi:alpha-tubulin suppressor-like RCC1 family protein
MAINFPDSPSVNDVFTDSDSGFSYQWTGEVWKSYLDAKIGDVAKFDDISGSFDGNTTTFALTFNGTPVTPDISPETIVLSLGGVIQNPQQDFTIGGSNITFTTAPAEGLTFFATRYETGLSKDYISSNVISPSGLSTGGFSWNTSNDLYISGVATVSNTGTASTALTVLGDTRISGILTVGSSSITIDGGTNRITGTGITLSSDGIVSSAVTATTYSGDGANLAGAGLTDGASINTTGIITATKFVGDATNLTDVGGELDGIVFNPSIGSTSVGVTTALKITFNKAIQANAGTITLRTNAADGTIVESYDIATVGSSSTISINGSVLQVTPSTALAGITTHFLVVPVGAVKDVFGISTSLVIDDYSFITIDGQPPGELYAWGYNAYGGLGLNDTAHRSSPVQIPGTNWTYVHDNYLNTTATKSDGTLWNWGHSTYGSPNNDRIDRSSPTQVPGTQWAPAIGGDYLNYIAKKTDNTLWAWGDGTYGQLGNNVGGTGKYFSSPAQIGGTQWDLVTMNSYAHYNCGATKTDGTWWVWGYNLTGGLGTNDTIAYSSPVQIPGTNWDLTSIHTFTVGAMCAGVKTDGTLWSWGYNGYGQTGHGNRVNYSSPTQLPGIEWKHVNNGTTHILATKTDGTLWGIGYNAYGQLGNGNATHYSSPVQVPGTQWEKPFGGHISSACFKTDGTLWTWGAGAFGQLDRNTGTSAADRSSPVQIPGTQWDRYTGKVYNKLAIKAST